ERDNATTFFHCRSERPVWASVRRMSLGRTKPIRSAWRTTTWATSRRSVVLMPLLHLLVESATRPSFNNPLVTTRGRSTREKEDTLRLQFILSTSFRRQSDSRALFFVVLLYRLSITQGVLESGSRNCGESESGDPALLAAPVQGPESAKQPAEVSKLQPGR